VDEHHQGLGKSHRNGEFEENVWVPAGKICDYHSGIDDSLYDLTCDLSRSRVKIRPQYL
jgi:hypothetical protein